MVENLCLSTDSSQSVCRLYSSKTSEKISGNQRQAAILTKKPDSLRI